MFRKLTGRHPASGALAIPLAALILSIIFTVCLRDKGTAYAFKWMVCLFLIALFLRPLLCIRRLPLLDGGFSLSMGLGTGASFVLVWFFSAAHLVAFDSWSCWAGLIILTVIVNIFSLKKRTAFSWDRKELIKFLKGFFIFSVLFLLAFYVKGFNAGIGCQTEQYMDYGFMQTMYRQKELAPYDFWFSGERLNYYYLGQAMAVYLCRLSFSTPEYGYNLMLCTISAAVFMMSLSMVFGVSSYYYSQTKGTNRAGCLIGALMGALLTACGANGHYLVYGLFLPFIEKITGKELVNDFWFPDSTVFIGSHTDIVDNGKHEFPAYSVILGDLHAHVCNMLLTLPLLAILFDYAADSSFKAEGIQATEDEGKILDWLFNKNNEGALGHKKADGEYLRVLKEVKRESYRAELKREKEKEREAEREEEEAYSSGHPLTYLGRFDRSELYSGYIFIIAVLLGLFCGVNYWDFPIYFVIAGAVILFCDLRKYGMSLKTVVFVLLKGAVILTVSKLIMLPFSLSYEKIYSEIKLCDNHTALWQLLLIWGPRVGAVLCFLGYIILAYKRKKSLSAMELCFTALILCAIGLIITPEVIYIKDIYGDDYQRYNTMFKLTYQGHILLGLLTGITISVFLNGKRLLKALAWVFIVFGLLSSSYIVVSADMWFGDLLSPSLRKGISAVDFLRRGDDEFSREFGAIEYLNEQDERHINIVEAAGTSYQPDCKLSVFTGANTVIGWYVHEWLWRSVPGLVGHRSDEVRYFYGGGDKDYCRDFVKRYKIDYIYVGPREYNYYYIEPEGFKGISKEVWREGDYYLLKVDEDALALSVTS